MRYHVVAVILALMGLSVLDAIPVNAEGLSKEQGDAILQDLRSIRLLMHASRLCYRPPNKFIPALESIPEL